MNKITITIISATLLYFTAAAQPVRKAMFVIVDGISADVIEKIATPALDNIASVGGYTRAHVGGRKGDYTQTPTISAVGYNSLLTGTWVNKHSVWGNDIKRPNYHYPTIFRLFKSQYPEKKTAIFSSWEDNRTKLIGEGLPATGGIMLDHHFDGLEHDTVRYPHDKARDFMHRIDEAVVNAAAEHVRKEAPDLSWVYLEYTDDMGHAHGDSEAFYRAVRLMDAQVGRLWEAIQYRIKNHDEDWVIYITTDHGRDAKTGKGHGGQSDRERSTWIVSNAKGLNTYYRTGNPGIVDIMPTLAGFLDIAVPKPVLMEIDGIPLTGKVYASDLSANWKNQDTLQLKWNVLEQQGTAGVWVSFSNHFRDGGEDKYELLMKVPVENGAALIPLKKAEAPFVKVVLETPAHFLNRWVGAAEGKGK